MAMGMIAMLLFALATHPAPMPNRVRTLSTRARDTLADGLRRSPTIARLVAELQRADVIVFVDTRLDPDIPTGETMLIGASGGVRFVSVLLNPAMTEDARVEYLGHELQHAAEIAVDPSTVDGLSVRRRFAAIGRELTTSRSSDKAFETDGARLVSLAIRRELAGRARGGTAPH